MRKPHKRIRNRLGCRRSVSQDTMRCRKEDSNPHGFPTCLKKTVNHSQYGHVHHGLFDFILQKDNLQNTTVEVGAHRSGWLPNTLVKVIG